MKVGSGYKNIWSISYPIILGGLANTLLNLTGTAFIARLGETELASMALNSIFYFVVAMIGISIGTGSQILMARRAGEGDRTEIGRIFNQSIIALSAASVVFFLLLYYLSPNIFRSLLTSPDIVAASDQYMQVRSFGIFFSFIAVTFRSFFISISHTRIITYSAILLLASNVVLDYGLIFGKLGLPEMGIRGAGLAAVISEAISLSYLILYAVIKNEFKEFGLFKSFNFSPYRMKSIFHLASPVILQNLVSMGAWFIFFVVIEHMGQHALAISNIVRSIYMLMMTPVWGFAAATNSMVSNIIGQGKRDEIKNLVLRIIHLSVGTSMVIMLFSFIFPDWLLSITTSDSQLINDSLGCFRIITFATLLLSVSLVLLNAVSGTGSTRAAMGIEIINIMIYLTYVYFCAIILNASVEWVWASEIFYWSMMGLLSAWYLKTGKWQKIKI